MLKKNPYNEDSSLLIEELTKLSDRNHSGESVERMNRLKEQFSVLAGRSNPTPYRPLSSKSRTGSR